jgi:hypothetical protein
VANTGKTQVAYTINLDDSRKSKPNEGETSFYKVPVGTAVKIEAVVTGPEEGVFVAWQEEIKKPAAEPGSPARKELLWQYAPASPASLEVYGQAGKERKVNGESMITYEEKKFVVEWAYLLEMEVTDTSFEHIETIPEKNGEGKQESMCIIVELQFKNNTDEAIDLNKLSYKGKLKFKNNYYSINIEPGSINIALGSTNIESGSIKIAPGSTNIESGSTKIASSSIISPEKSPEKSPEISTLIQKGATASAKVKTKGILKNKHGVKSSEYEGKLKNDLQAIKLNANGPNQGQEESNNASLSKVTWGDNEYR